jgi:hypothetical protein
MSLISNEKTIQSRKFSKFKFISLNEIFLFGTVIIVGILSTFYILGTYIAQNNNLIYNPADWNWYYFITVDYFQMLVFSGLFSLLLSINCYFVVSYIYIKNKGIQPKLSPTQEITKILFVNCFILFSFYLTSYGGYINYFGSTAYIFYDSLFKISVFSLSVYFTIIFFIILPRYLSKKKSDKKPEFIDKSFLQVINKNFLLFFIINFFICWYFLVYLVNFELAHLLFIISIVINITIPILKFGFDRKYLQFSLSTAFKSFISNVLFFSIVFIQYFQIYQIRYDLYNYSPLYGARIHEIMNQLVLAYILTGILILMYYYREKLSDFSHLMYKNIKVYGIIVIGFSYRNLKKHNPISFFKYQFTLRKLSNHDQAVFFTKKYIIIQSKFLKNALPGALPQTISNTIEKIFENDIERLQQLFKINNIKTYSNKAILKFVMITANLIIKDLQRTLQEHLTEELLKENNDAKSLQVNVEDLWKKANKIMLQWESTFTDTELSYKDTLLHK